MPGKTGQVGAEVLGMYLAVFWAAEANAAEARVAGDCCRGGGGVGTGGGRGAGGLGTVGEAATGATAPGRAGEAEEAADGAASAGTAAGAMPPGLAPCLSLW